MVTQDRWQTAQAYERNYWQGIGAEIAEDRREQLGWYASRAQDLAGLLTRAGCGRLTDGTARMIEVGCGPIGIAPFFPAARKLAVDPLENFYASNDTLVQLRRPDVQYVQGTGEALPAGDGEFDLAVIDNCIDHVRDVDAVMRELRRVLASNGVLFLTVNCRTSLGYGVHRVVSKLEIDAGHPHTFTTGRVSQMFARNGFRILDAHSDSYLKALKEDIRTPALKPRMKALLGTSEFVTTVIATPLR